MKRKSKHAIYVAITARLPVQTYGRLKALADLQGQPIIKTARWLLHLGLATLDGQECSIRQSLDDSAELIRVAEARRQGAALIAQARKPIRPAARQEQ